MREGKKIGTVYTQHWLLTNQRIMTIVESLVKRIVYLTCNNQHNYHQLPGVRDLVAVQIWFIFKELKKTFTPTDGLRIFAQRKRFRDELNGITCPPHHYYSQKKYINSEALNHFKFNLNFVQKIIRSNKAEVMFENSLKILTINTGSGNRAAPDQKQDNDLACCASFIK